LRSESTFGTLRKPTGVGAATLMAAALGMFAIGIVTPLAEAFEAFSSRLDWWDPAGPLTGKTGVGVLVWLMTWAGLLRRYRNREVDIGRHLVWMWVLIAFSFLGTFPPLYRLLANGLTALTN
jgi:hypothetical protein